MTLREIVDTLKKEFPNEYSSFTIEVNVYPHSVNIDICLYTKTKGFVQGTSFEDCLNKFRALNSKPSLDQEVPQMGEKSFKERQKEWDNEPEV